MGTVFFCNSNIHSGKQQRFIPPPPPINIMILFLQKENKVLSKIAPWGPSMNLLYLTTDLTMAPTVTLLDPQPVDECSGGTYSKEGGCNRGSGGNDHWSGCSRGGDDGSRNSGNGRGRQQPIIDWFSSRVVQCVPKPVQILRLHRFGVIPNRQFTNSAFLFKYLTDHFTRKYKKTIDHPFFASC